MSTQITYQPNEMQMRSSTKPTLSCHTFPSYSTDEQMPYSHFLSAQQEEWVGSHQDQTNSHYYYAPDASFSDASSSLGTPDMSLYEQQISCLLDCTPFLPSTHLMTDQSEPILASPYPCGYSPMYYDTAPLVPSLSYQDRTLLFEKQTNFALPNNLTPVPLESQPSTLEFDEKASFAFNSINSPSLPLVFHREGGKEVPVDQDSDNKCFTHSCQWLNCTETAPSLDKLMMHICDEHIGSGKATYFCEWKECARNKKPFMKRHKMHNHMRTHTGERPFVCAVDDCKKTFSRPDSLSTHIKTHSDVRPYGCSYHGCTKAYFHSRSLRKHIKAIHLKKTNSVRRNVAPSRLVAQQQKEALAL